MKIYKNDFPIFKNNLGLIYLDSAATSQKPQLVMNATREFYETYNANIHRGLYPLSEKATEKVEETRELVRKFINAKYKEEIIFTSGTTEGINLVAGTWGKENISNGDRITVTIAEHHANFVPWQRLSQEKKATFEVSSLDENLTPVFTGIKESKLLTLSHVSNVLGLVNPVEDIIKGQKLLNPKLRVLVDAAQSVPHMKVDVQKMDCDFLVFSGHKLFAETGIGVLYAKKELLESMPPFLTGGDMIREVKVDTTTYADIPHKFEAGTLNISGIISLGAAIRYIEAVGYDVIRRHEEALLAYCRDGLQTIKGVSIIGEGSTLQRSGLITFTVDGVHPHDLAQMMGDNNICLRAGHHCAMPLHTVLGLSATTRVSFSLYNTKEDVDIFLQNIHSIKQFFK